MGENLLFDGTFEISVPATSQAADQRGQDRGFVFAGEQVQVDVVLRHPKLKQCEANALEGQQERAEPAANTRSDKARISQEEWGALVSYLSLLRVTASFLPSHSSTPAPNPHSSLAQSLLVSSVVTPVAAFALPQMFRTLHPNPDPPPRVLESPVKGTLKSVGVINLAEADGLAPDAGAAQTPQGRSVRALEPVLEPPNENPKGDQQADAVQFQACDGARFAHLPGGAVLFRVPLSCPADWQEPQDTKWFLVVSFTGPPLSEAPSICSGFEDNSDVEFLGMVYAQSRLLRPQRPLVNSAIEVQLLRPFVATSTLKRVGMQVFASTSIRNPHKDHVIEILGSQLSLDSPLLVRNDWPLRVRCHATPLAGECVVLRPGEQLSLFHALTFEHVPRRQGASPPEPVMRVPLLVRWQCRGVTTRPVSSVHELPVPTPPTASVVLDAKVPASVQPMQQFDLHLSIHNLCDEPREYLLALPVSWSQQGAQHGSSSSSELEPQPHNSPLRRAAGGKEAPSAPGAVSTVGRPIPILSNPSGSAGVVDNRNSFGLSTLARGVKQTMRFKKLPMRTSVFGRDGLGRSVGQDEDNDNGHSANVASRRDGASNSHDGSVEIRVTVPEHAKPGQMFCVAAEGDQLLMFVIPTGAKTGQQIAVEAYPLTQRPGLVEQDERQAPSGHRDAILSPAQSPEPSPDLAHVSSLFSASLGKRHDELHAVGLGAVVPLLQSIRVGVVDAFASRDVVVPCVAIGEGEVIAIQDVQVVDLTGGHWCMARRLCDVVVGGVGA